MASDDILLNIQELAHEEHELASARAVASFPRRLESGFGGWKTGLTNAGISCDSGGPALAQGSIPMKLRCEKSTRSSTTASRRVRQTTENVLTEGRLPLEKHRHLDQDKFPPFAIRRFGEQGNNIVHWSDFERGGSDQARFAASATAERAPCGSVRSRASFARWRHSAIVCAFSEARTIGAPAGDIERLDTPRPTRTRAKTGSLAASPQTPTGVAEARTPVRMSRTNRISAGCQ